MAENEFVTSDTPYEDATPVQEVVKPKNENIKGIVTSGWVLAFVLPFVGAIINWWLIRNNKKYNLNIISSLTALVISCVLSGAILFYLFYTLYFYFIIG